MKRFGANKIYLEADNFLLNSVFEIDKNRICAIYALADCQTEPSQTVFYNGTIVAVKLENDFLEKMCQKLPLREVLKTETAKIAVGASVQLFLLHTTDFETFASEIKVTKL